MCKYNPMMIIKKMWKNENWNRYKKTKCLYREYIKKENQKKTPIYVQPENKSPWISTIIINS